MGPGKGEHLVDRARGVGHRELDGADDSRRVLARTLHTPAGLVGVPLATEGVGSLVGALLTTRITARLGTARAFVGAAVVTVAGASVVPLGAGHPAYLTFPCGNAVFAGAVVVLSVTARTYRQIASPPDLLAGSWRRSLRGVGRDPRRRRARG